MTRVDFYLLEDSEIDAARRFACRLCIKAIESRMTVHIQSDDEESAKDLDRLLWDYPEERFLPHQLIIPHDNKLQAPIHIGFGEPVFDSGLLINFAAEIPQFFSRFDRVAEIVVGDTKARGRDHYRYYRERGFLLNHHDIKNWED